MKTPEIITAIIAVYAAILSTISIVKQLLTDPVKIRLSIKRDMVIIGDPHYDGVTLAVLEITNMGRRPVTITSCGASRLCPGMPFVAANNLLLLPSEVTEGKYISTMMNQKSIDFTTIDYWKAQDSRGKIYKLRESSFSLCATRGGNICAHNCSL